MAEIKHLIAKDIFVSFVRKINFVPSHQSIYKEFHDFHCMLVNAYEIQIDNFKSNLIKE